MFDGETFAILKLRHDRNYFAVEGAHFAGHFAERRFHFGNATLRLDPLFDVDNSDSERGCLLKNYFGAIVFVIVVGEHRQNVRRTIFLHVNRRRPHVERARPQQSIVKITVNLRIHIIDVGFKFEELPRLLFGGRPVINPQHVGNFEIVSARAVPYFFDR